MTSKVFLIGDSWLYCDDVKFENGCWEGHVINGNWHLVYDTSFETAMCFAFTYDLEPQSNPKTTFKGKLEWIGDPQGGDYNDVIEKCKRRYKNGEPSNYTIKDEPEEILEDDIPY